MPSLSQLNDFLRRLRLHLPLEMRTWVDQQARVLAAQSSFGHAQSWQLTQALTRLRSSAGASTTVDALGNVMKMMALGQAAAQQTASAGSSGLLPAFQESLASLARRSSQPTASSTSQSMAGQGLNLQYLALQQRLQDESRRFTLISNIMAAKHDSARLAISPLR